MIELLCKDCGATLDDIDVISLGSSIKIKIEPCDCESTKCYNQDNCDHYKELEDEISVAMVQQQVDIEGNDEMIEKIRKVAEEMGGKFRTKIEEILNEF